MSEEMPAPPYPNPQDGILKLIVTRAYEELERGEEPKDVLLNAVVHAWMEGHLEGHDCAGDEEEHGDSGVRRALREGKTISPPQDRIVATPEQIARVAANMRVSYDYLVEKYGADVSP